MRFEEFGERYTLTESILESVAIVRHQRDVRLEFGAGWMGLPEGEPQPRWVVLTCRNFVRLAAERDVEGALLRHPLDANDRAQDGRKTVLGVGLDDPSGSRFREGLGNRWRDFLYLFVATMDADLEIVCEEIEAEVGFGEDAMAQATSTT